MIGPTLEVWRGICGFYPYEVSSHGRIRRGERILKPQGNGHGYRFVSLSIDGVVTKRYVHRLVALEFLPNPDILPEVNHLFGVDLGDAILNLEWATKSWNATHAYQILGRKHPMEGKKGENSPASKPWVVTDPEGKVYSVVGLHEFCRLHSLDQSAMWRVANGKRTHHKGWKCEQT